MPLIHFTVYILPNIKHSDINNFPFLYSPMVEWTVELKRYINAFYKIVKIQQIEKKKKNY